MEDSRQVDALKALAEAKRREESVDRQTLASVRVSPGGYLAVASIFTFVSALLLRGESNKLALVSLGLAWGIMPALALTDRIVFDGRCLSRRGLIPLLLNLVSGKRVRLNVADFERVHTNAVRTLRRGGSVRYRYRTQIIGKGLSFVFASGGKSYRQMVRELFPLIEEQKLDARTQELRDYICEPSALTERIRQLQLASSDVLDNAESDLKKRTGKPVLQIQHDVNDLERAQLLRRLANQLRIIGRLRESREAFRRALIVTPQDGGLIYEFARLLRSQASSMGDARLLSRARAALRLAAMRSRKNAKLLSSIGESLIECGDTVLAERILYRAIEVDDHNVRARVELADLALRNGKLAHVIHHFGDAAREAPDKALAGYARGEADYYVRLNDDEDYLSTELRRISWLQHASRVRRMAARVTNASILLALAGQYVDPLVGGIGWSMATTAIAGWVFSLFAIKLLSERRTPRLED